MEDPNEQPSAPPAVAAELTTAVGDLDQIRAGLRQRLKEPAVANRLDPEAGRAWALGVTNLEQAIMWLEKARRIQAGREPAAG